MGMGFAPTWLRQVSPPPVLHKTIFTTAPILSPSLSLRSHHLLFPLFATRMYGGALISSPSGSTKCLLLLFEPKILCAILMTKQTENGSFDASYRLQPFVDHTP